MEPSFAAFAVCVPLLLAAVCLTVPRPYMDEEFHIKQTAAFLQQGLSAPYDPAITTPPGLYLLALPLLKLLPRVFRSPLALTQILRAVNSMMLLCLYPTLCWCRTCLLPKGTVRSHGPGLVYILLYPPLFFSSFLCAAGILSLVCVPDGPSPPAAKATPIWLVFCGGLALLHHHDVLLTSRLPLPILRSSLRLWPLYVATALFAAFVVWNGSIVLGHQEYHQAGLHFAQLVYVMPFMAVFGGLQAVFASSVCFALDGAVFAGYFVFCCGVAVVFNCSSLHSGRQQTLDLLFMELLFWLSVWRSGPLAGMSNLLSIRATGHLTSAQAASSVEAGLSFLVNVATL
eukprot:gene7162-1279_t